MAEHWILDDAINSTVDSVTLVQNFLMDQCPQRASGHIGIASSIPKDRIESRTPGS
jgi:hypothetical protein